MSDDEMKRLAIMVADELEGRQAARQQVVHHYHHAPLPPGTIGPHYIGTPVMPYQDPRPLEVTCGRKVGDGAFNSCQPSVLAHSTGR